MPVIIMFLAIFITWIAVGEINAGAIIAQALVVIVSALYQIKVEISNLKDK